MSAFPLCPVRSGYPVDSPFCVCVHYRAGARPRASEDEVLEARVAGIQLAISSSRDGSSRVAWTHETARRYRLACRSMAESLESGVRFRTCLFGSRAAAGGIWSPVVATRCSGAQRMCLTNTRNSSESVTEFDYRGTKSGEVLSQFARAVLLEDRSPPALFMIKIFRFRYL